MYYYPSYTAPDTAPYYQNPNYIGDPIPPNDPNYFTVPSYPNYWQQWTTPTKTVKKTTTTLEKYNTKGKLVSREITVVEEEIIDTPATTPYTSEPDSPYITTTFDKGDLHPNDPDINWHFNGGTNNESIENVVFGSNNMKIT